MKEWIDELINDCKKTEWPQGLLLSFSRLYEKEAEIKLKIYNVTGSIKGHEKPDDELPVSEKIVDLETEVKSKRFEAASGPELNVLQTDLSVLEDAEKELLSLYGKTTLNPAWVKDIKMIHGTILHIEIAKNTAIQKLKAQLNNVLMSHSKQQKKLEPKN